MPRPLRSFGRRAASLALGLLAAALAGQAAHAQESAHALEQATKAAMIYNFSRFTVWPDSRFARSDDPVVLCVDPADPLAPILASLDGKPLGGRNLSVRRTAKIDHACNMAYVSSANANEGYLQSLRDRGVLTIGETSDFSRSGAIQLITIGRQVRFEINQTAATASGAHLSSNLLRLAVAVR
jgi:hypothetical protein